ncbi:MAG: hypothetical protein IPM69_05695 [Ignavibacteria bacterium]|nr:hypothetical protein [Ignavibacteria bacterium]
MYLYKIRGNGLRSEFLAQTGGMNAWVTTTGIRYDFYVQTMKKADKSEQILTEYTPDDINRSWQCRRYGICRGKSPHDAPNLLHNTYYNYFIGTDKSRWASNVPLFGEVTRREIYKGIDARLYFDGGFMRYDFNVGVSSNPQDIQVKF